jgi:hypothetical protein
MQLQNPAYIRRDKRLARKKRFSRCLFPIYDPRPEMLALLNPDNQHKSLFFVAHGKVHSDKLTNTIRISLGCQFAPELCSSPQKRMVQLLSCTMGQVILCRLSA